MSSFQGVGIEEFHCIQRCPHFRGLEWRSSTVYRGVLISGCWNRGVPLYNYVKICNQPPFSFIQFTKIFIVPTSVTYTHTLHHLLYQRSGTNLMVVSKQPQNLIATFTLCYLLNSDSWSIVTGEYHGNGYYNNTKKTILLANKLAIEFMLQDKDFIPSSNPLK